MISREGGNFAFGVTVGALLFLTSAVFLELFDLDISENDTLVGAVVGGVIAAIAAILGQILLILDGVKRAEDKDFLRRQAVVRTICVKIMDLLGEAQKSHNYYRTYDPLTVVSVEDNLGRTRVVLVKPLRGARKVVSFTVDERVVAIEDRDHNLFNVLSDLNGAMSNISFLEGKYSEAFDRFHEWQVSNGVSSVINGKVETVSGADFVSLSELESLLKLLRLALIAHLPLLKSSLAAAISVLSERYKTNLDLDFDESIGGLADYAFSHHS